MKIPKPTKPITAVKKTSRPGSTKKPTGAPSGPGIKPPTKPGGPAAEKKLTKQYGLNQKKTK